MHVLIHVFDVLDSWHLRVVVHDDQGEDWAEPVVQRSMTWPAAQGAKRPRDLLAEVGENILELAYDGPTLSGS